MRLRKSIICFLLAAFVLLTAACGDSTGSAQALYNSPQSDEIHIGIAYPVELRNQDTFFEQGIELAINNINAGGGVLGKTLSPVIRDDRNDTHVAMQIAETFHDQGITAVIGHWGTNICYYVQDIYEENGVVMLTPDATGTNLFDNEYQYVYRMIANNQVFAETIADYMRDEKLTRIAIYYSDDEYGADFSASLEKELATRHIDVVDRVTSITPSNIETIMKRWKAFGCDGVIMAALPPEIIEPIQLIHDADNLLPIFGADNFDRTTFAGELSRYADSIYMASYRIDGLNTDFLDAFRAAYGRDPDIHAITGYESVFLLRDAMEATGTTDGSAIAEYLSGLTDYNAISGLHSYNPETQELDGFDIAVRKLR